MHQAHNYPAYKPPSSIDVHLPDATNDEEYLGWLDQALSSAFRHFEPELICYIAGADPYKEDQLGGLALTIDGLKRRDELVFKVAKTRNIPVMVTYAGGYAHRVEDTVTIHCNTVQAAKEIFPAMRIQLVRHATLLIDYANMRLLVDPMLSDAGAMAAIQNSPHPQTESSCALANAGGTGA